MNHLKKIQTLTLWTTFILTIHHTTFGQSGFSQKYGTENDYKRLYYLNTQYLQSWIRSDTATYNSLLWAEDFLLQNADGSIYPKRQLMQLYGKPRFDKIEYFFTENVIVQFITDSAAMVLARTPLRIVGQTSESVTQYNDLYVKRKGKWKCVEANITGLSKPGDPAVSFTKIPTPTPAHHISIYPGTEEDKKKLTELNEKHARGFLRSKVKLVENILAEDFILLSSNGLLYRKDDILEQIKSEAKTNSIDTYRIENLAIRFVALNIAVVHAVIVFKTTDGKTSAVQYNDIYAKRNGWVCVSGNNALIRN
jgi:hypothetical protein